jgi:hypothetical protein
MVTDNRQQAAPQGQQIRQSQQPQQRGVPVQQQQQQRPPQQQRRVQQQPQYQPPQQREEYYEEDDEEYEDGYDNYEEPMARIRASPQVPVYQGFTPEQVDIIKCVEHINIIITDPRSKTLYPAVTLERLINAEIYLLIMSGLKGMLGDYVAIPVQETPPQQVSPQVPQVQQQPVVHPPEVNDTLIPDAEEVIDIPDLPVDPQFKDHKTDMDMLSSRLDGIDKGVTENAKEEPPKGALAGIMAKISKPKAPEKVIKNANQPESMG